MTVSYKPSKLVNQGRLKLRAAGQPEIGALYLMMDLFDLSQLEIIMDDKELSEEEHELYSSSLLSLCEEKPLAHITGSQIFYGRLFKVTPDVLVPRPETEELVMKVLAVLKHGTVADIGTGSGCIAVTLALEHPFDVHAVDISRPALSVAAENAAHYSADISFYEGNLLAPLIQRGIKLDALVSNPPYIAQEERHLMNKTALHDPEIALFAEHNGLRLYHEMIDQLDRVMKPGGYIFFEIGHAQGEHLWNYIETRYDVEVHIEQDINQLDRILWFQWCE